MTPLAIDRLERDVARLLRRKLHLLLLGYDRHAAMVDDSARRRARVIARRVAPIASRDAA